MRSLPTGRKLPIFVFTTLVTATGHVLAVPSSPRRRRPGHTSPNSPALTTTARRLGMASLVSTAETWWSAVFVEI